MKGLLTVLNQNTANIADAQDRLGMFVQESLNFFDRNQDFFRIFFSERNKGQILKDTKLTKSSIMLQHKEFITGLIKSGQEQRVIRNDFGPQQIADILASIFMTVIFDWFKEGQKDARKLKEVAGFILDIFLSGAGKKR